MEERKDICEGYERDSVQQLDKLAKDKNERLPIYPLTYIQAVYDARTKERLDSILWKCNNVYLPWMGSAGDTRIQLPFWMRRKGIIITYKNLAEETITEKLTYDLCIADDFLRLDSSWTRITDALPVGGNITIGSNGNWFQDGVDTGFKAQGPKGDNGLTPMLRTVNNKLQYSYDGEVWNEISEYISAWFRYQDNKIQISRNQKTWSDLSSPFTQDLYIKGYVATSSELPSTGVKQGDIYMVGPTYASEDTGYTNPIYRMYVYNDSGWVDNGVFQSIAAGVVQTIGNSETEVMSQKAVSSIVGLDTYSTFSSTINYAKGEVVNYNGFLYEFSEDHAAGVWIGADAEKTSLRKNTKEKIIKIEQEVANIEHKVIGYEKNVDSGPIKFCGEFKNGETYIFSVPDIITNASFYGFRSDDMSDYDDLGFFTKDLKTRILTLTDNYKFIRFYSDNAYRARIWPLISLQPLSIEIDNLQDEISLLIKYSNNMSVDSGQANFYHDFKAGEKYIFGTKGISSLTPVYGFRSNVDTDYKLLGFVPENGVIEIELTENYQFIRFYNNTSYTAYIIDTNDIRAKVYKLEESTTNLKEDELLMCLPNKIFAIKGLEYNIYKSSIMIDPNKDVDIFTYPRTETNFQADPIQVGISCKISNIKDTVFRVGFRDYIRMEQRLIYNDLQSVWNDVSSPINKKVNVIGDSITNRGAGNFASKAAKSIGCSIIGFGTMNNYGSFKGEGREGWTCANFIGKSSICGSGTISVMGSGTSGSLTKNPFIREATDVDKQQYPNYCFTSTGVENEKSYAEDGSQNTYYIFDYAFYLNRWSGSNTPDVLTIALGTNDVIQSYSVQDYVDYLNFMVSRIKYAVPNVKIGILPSPAWGTTFDFKRVVPYIEAVKKKFAEIENVDIVGLWCFMNRFLSFGLKTSEVIAINESTNSAPYNENIHFDSGDGGKKAYIEYGKVLASYILNQ